MSAPVTPVPTDPVDYPESDGQPMADNSKQFDWIVVLAGNLKALFRDRPDVFAAVEERVDCLLEEMNSSA